MSVATEPARLGYQSPERGGRFATVFGFGALGILGALLAVATHADQEAMAIALIVATILLAVVVARGTRLHGRDDDASVQVGRRGDDLPRGHPQQPGTQR